MLSIYDKVWDTWFVNLWVTSKVDEPGYKGLDVLMSAKSFSLLLMYIKLSMQLDWVYSLGLSNKGLSNKIVFYWLVH